MPPDDQPTIRTAPPNGSRPAPVGWQAPSVETMQAMLPQYEIIEILGRGGMGAVYKARQKSLKRLVAIKILPLGMADDEMKFAERFQNEAQTMAAMNHPAIVSVYDFGETPDGLLYFIMEFVDGTDVQKMIQASGKLSGDYALAITAHVCDALSYAHKRGVIHRDIKPANILIDQEGHIKVADFGLAKMSDPSQTSGLTKTNMAMGTPDYVAPEVLVTGMVADHRADIYAVGVMLYQMLTGEVPRGMFKLPSQKGLGTDVRFDEIICKAMEQDREERYQSAMDVRRALDVILTTPQPKDDGTGIVPVKDIPQKPVAKGPRPPGEKNGPPPKGSVEKKPTDKSVRAPAKKASATSTWLGIGGIVAVLGVAGFLVLGGKPKPQASAATDSASATAPSAKPQPPIKVRENPKPTAAATSASAKGKEIDLLALVDVKRDAIAGEWVRTADGLVKKGGNTTSEGAPRLQLPYQPPDEYDYEIEFTPTTGTQSLGQMIAAQSRMFSWIINGGRTGEPMSGFEMFDGKATSTPSEVSKQMDADLVNGRRYRSRVEVRSGSLRALLDDREIVNWSGKLQRLSLDTPSRLHDDNHLGLRAVRETTFHKITVREITGTGKVDAGTATTSSSATAKTIDLLPLVDVKRDTIAGAWSRDGGDLLVKATKPDAKGTPRLQLPYQPPEEYDFEIEFTPESGTNMVGQVLSAYQHSFEWLLDAQLNAGRKAGFNEIEGVSLAGRTDGTTMRTKFLTNGQRHRSTIEVRRNRVQALLDGESLVIWGRSPQSYERLDISKNEKMRDALHLGLAAYDRAVRFHKITVREVTGVGKVDASVTDTVAKPDDVPNITNWQDVTENARERARGTSGLLVGNDGAISRTSADVTPILPLASQVPRDHALRVRYTGEVQAAMRRQGRDYLFALCQMKQTIFMRFRADAADSKSERIGATKTHPTSFDPAHEHELLVTMQGSQLRVWMDGVFWGEGQDDSIKDGTAELMFGAQTVVKKVEIAELAAGAPPPPFAANWQDVTGTVMEQAKAKPGFTFEGDLIAWTGDKKNPPHITVTPAGRSDYSVRLKHVSAGQINVRFNEKGFVYVQTASSGLRISRWMKGVAAPVTLLAPQPISFSYKEGEPHDLTVTVQGSTIRAWLDGQLMGTVEDTMFAEGTGAIAFVSYGKVQKVEVGDLSAGTNSAKWQPIFNQPSDFGSDLRDVEFRDGATFIKARTFRAPADPAIVGIRSTLRYLEGDRTGSLTIRSTEAAQYGEEDFGLTAFIAPKGATLVIKMRDRPAGINQLGRHDFPLSPALKEGELFTFELRVADKKITAIINGREVGSVSDAWTGATRRFGITPSNTDMTEFRDVAVLLANSPQAQPAQTFNGHRYLYVPGDFKWEEAKAEAEKRGGHLAVITSAEENDWAWKTFSTQLPQQPKEDRWKRGWWLGASQTAVEKPWSWLTGEPLSYESWGVKEPSTSINPPRYLWMADANKDEGTSNWSAQNAWIRGGYLVEWDTTGG